MKVHHVGSIQNLAQMEQAGQSVSRWDRKFQDATQEFGDRSSFFLCADRLHNTSTKNRRQGALEASLPTRNAHKLANLRAKAAMRCSIPSLLPRRIPDVIAIVRGHNWDPFHCAHRGVAAPGFRCGICASQGQGPGGCGGVGGQGGTGAGQSSFVL